MDFNQAMKAFMFLRLGMLVGAGVAVCFGLNSVAITLAGSAFVLNRASLTIALQSRILAFTDKIDLSTAHTMIEEMKRQGEAG